MVESNTVSLRDKRKGTMSGAIACILALVGIFTFGVIFVPLAVVVAILSTLLSLVNGNMTGVGLNVLGWVLIVIGFATSPVLLAVIGVAVLPAP